MNAREFHELWSQLAVIIVEDFKSIEYATSQENAPSLRETLNNLKNIGWQLYSISARLKEILEEREVSLKPSSNGNTFGLTED